MTKALALAMALTLALTLTSCQTGAMVLTSMGDAMRDQPSRETPATTPRRPTEDCSSDYGCGFGSRCVKAPGATHGRCAREVDVLGNPTYGAPDPNSVLPGGPGQCGFDAECPVGFRCAVEPGAIRGACVRP